MKVVVARPPVYDDICAALGVPAETVVYTWGETIFSPSGDFLPHDVLVHENVHRMQQRAIGGPETWWATYLADARFRFLQELEAYQSQYRSYCEGVRDRNERERFLTRIAGTLAGRLYGGVVTFGEARMRIKGV